jgi:cytochrome b561
LSYEAGVLLRDTEAGYGVVSRLLHWAMAIAIITLFALGWWMVGLDYYSAYYTSAPDLHRGAGILVAFALVLRLVWRAANPRPANPELSRLEHVASRIAHGLMYALVVAVTVTGYLISTADGRAIDVFGWFSMPAMLSGPNQEDVAGFLHRYLSYGLVGLAAVHAAAAFKHYFSGHPGVMTRMWSGPSKRDQL